jgi:hypothetical protein
VTDRIAALTNELMSFVRRDHHKTRDCVYSICKVYDCGAPAIYRVVHDGYVFSGIREDFKSYREAEDYLATELEVRIAEAKDWDQE